MTSPSGDGFEIDPRAVLMSQQALTTVSGKLRTALSNIDDEANKLLGGWEGEAREAFLARQAKWKNDADVILQKLVQLVSGIEQSVHGYVGADNKGANAIIDGSG
jgi:WXG100 family type VII secretion target